MLLLILNFLLQRLLQGHRFQRLLDNLTNDSDEDVSAVGRRIGESVAISERLRDNLSWGNQVVAYLVAGVLAATTLILSLVPGINEEPLRYAIVGLLAYAVALEFLFLVALLSNKLVHPGERFVSLIWSLAYGLLAWGTLGLGFWEGHLQQ